MINNIRYAAYRTKFRYGQYLPLRAPVDVSLELASVCSMKCSYCYWGDPTNIPWAKGLMKKDMALNILNQAAELGVNSLKFNYRGEGTLNPHYAEITAYAKRLAKGSTFIDRLANSNFKFPKNKRDEIFLGLANLTKVKVSYDSFNKEVFEYQRAGGDHDLTTENIDLFYNHAARKESGTKIVIQAVRTKLNLDEDIKGLAAQRWPDAEISIRDVVAGRTEKDTDEFTHKDRDFQNRKPCLQAFVRLMITSDGKALPCCPDIKENLVLGHVLDNSLKDIFNSYAAKKLRSDLKSGKAFNYESCKTCSSFESYKGHAAPWGS